MGIHTADRHDESNQLPDSWGPSDDAAECTASATNLSVPAKPTDPSGLANRFSNRAQGEQYPSNVPSHSLPLSITQDPLC